MGSPTQEVPRDEAALRAIERQAFDCWPAGEAVPLGEWQLRANRRVTNRANSAWAFGDPGLPTERAIAAVEAFYADRAQIPIFQLSPLTRPNELDAALETRGYESYAPVTVQVASAIDAAQGSPREGLELECHSHLDEDWFAMSGTMGRYRGNAVLIYRRMMERIAPRACFALARRVGEPVGVGLGVHGRGWVGIFSMLTLPEHRGLGVGREILREIAHWAAIRGGNYLYLQVEEENDAAQALYAGSGFETLYRYHYRRRETTSG